MKFKVVEDITNEKHEEEEEVISCVVDQAVSQIGPTDEVMIKYRAYPIFCAVRLSEYEISDRVCSVVNAATYFTNTLFSNCWWLLKK
jgi:hypothetical protein